MNFSTIKTYIKHAIDAASFAGGDGATGASGPAGATGSSGATGSAGGSSAFAQKQLAVKSTHFATTGVLSTDEAMLVLEDVTCNEGFMLNLEYSTNGTDFTGLPYPLISKPEGLLDAGTLVNIVLHLRGLVAGRGLTFGTVTGNFFGTPLGAYGGFPTLSLDGVVLASYNPGAQIVKWRVVTLDGGLAPAGTLSGEVRVMTPGGV